MMRARTGTMKAIAEDDFDAQRLVVEAIQAGDADAMAEFVRAQGRWVRGIVLGVLGRLETVDDVVQRVWIRVWREAPRLEDPSRWRAWLYRITRNAATDVGREKQRRRRLLGELFRQRDRQVSQSPPVDSVVADKEQQAAVLRAIAELPELYREPFVLRHLEDWSYRQIGETLGLPVDTVETRLVRARRILREKLAGKVQ